MKKKIILAVVVIALIMMPFGMIVGSSKSEVKYLSQSDSVDLVDFDGLGWVVTNAKVEYDDDNIVTSLIYGTLYDEGESKVGIKRHQDYYVFNDGNLLAKNEKEKESGVFDSKIIGKQLYLFDGYLYSVNNSNLADLDYGVTERGDLESLEYSKSYSLVKYDTDFKNVGYVELSNSNNKDILKFKKLDDGMIVLSYDDLVFNDFYEDEPTYECEIHKIDKDFKTASEIDCTFSNVKEYFPEFAFQLENALNDNESDLNGNESVMISDNNKIIYTDENGEEVEITTDIGNFVNVKFFKDKIVAIEDTVENKNVNFFYSKIDLYDKSGELVDQVAGLSSYRDIDVNEEDNKFVVSSITLEKTLAILPGDLYDDYDFSEAGLVYEEYVYREPEEEKPAVNIIPNPDTKDIIIMGFVVLFGVSLYYYIKFNKAKKDL